MPLIVAAPACNVRFGSKADNSERPLHVRFTPESGHWLSMKAPWRGSLSAFLKITADVRVAITHREPRDVAIIGVLSKLRICWCVRSLSRKYPAARTRSKNSEPFCSQNTVKSLADMTIGEL